MPAIRYAFLLFWPILGVIIPFNTFLPAHAEACPPIFDGGSCWSALHDDAYVEVHTLLIDGRLYYEVIGDGDISAYLSGGESLALWDSRWASITCSSSEILQLPDTIRVANQGEFSIDPSLGYYYIVGLSTTRSTGTCAGIYYPMTLQTELRLSKDIYKADERVVVSATTKSLDPSRQVLIEVIGPDGNQYYSNSMSSSQLIRDEFMASEVPGLYKVSADFGGEKAAAEFCVITCPFDAPPDILVPATIVKEATGDRIQVFYTVTANDDIDGNIAPLCHPKSGSFFLLGDTEVTCTVTDTTGNSVIESFTVRVNSPVIASDGDPPPILIGIIIAVAAAGAGSLVLIKRRRNIPTATSEHSPTVPVYGTSAPSQPVDTIIPQVLLVDPESLSEEIKCCICYDKFKPGQQVVHCPHTPCSAYAHRNEFEAWIAKNDICPLCRKRLRM